jgi:hypothetical protein
MVLEIFNNGISESGILRCVADEDGGRADARLILATAFNHLQPPEDCSASSRMPAALATGVNLEAKMAASRRRFQLAVGRLLGRSATVNPY